MLPLASCTTAQDYAAAILAVPKTTQQPPVANKDQVPLLDIRFRDAYGLTSTLNFIAKSYDDKVCLEVFQGKGLQIRAIDQAKSSFMDAFFPARSAPGQAPIFSRFECSQPYLPMWLNPGLLGKAIRTSIDGHKRQGGHRSSILHLRVDAADPDHLVLEAETSVGSAQRPTGVAKSTRQDLALLTPTSDTASCFIDGESFQFTADAMFEQPELLSEVLTDVKSSGCDEVSLTMSGTSLELSGRAGDNCSRLQVVLRSSSAGALSSMALSAPQGPVSASFKARHLLRLSHLCADSGMVLLQLGPDAPLSATFALRGGGTCQLFIAPTLDDDDVAAGDEPEREAKRQGEEEDEAVEEEEGWVQAKAASGTGKRSHATEWAREKGLGPCGAEPVQAAKRVKGQGANGVLEPSSSVSLVASSGACGGLSSGLAQSTLPYGCDGGLGDDDEVGLVG